MRQRNLAMSTRTSRGVSSGKVESQYLVDASSLRGHSTSRHSCGCGVARFRSREAGRIRMAAKRKVSAAIFAGSDSLLVHARGVRVPMTRWRAGVSYRDAAARMMKTSASWSPAPNLNVVNVQRGDHAWTVAVDSLAAYMLSGMRYAIQIASQRLLEKASGSVRSGSDGCHRRPSGALAVPKRSVRSAHLYRATSRSCGAIRPPDSPPGGNRPARWS